MPEIDKVFDAIRSERVFQEKMWPKSTALSVAGEMTLLRDYIRQFDKHYQEDNDGPHDVPPKCLHDLRKMAAILVRAMENSEALGR
jgi:hypothetical protein